MTLASSQRNALKDNSITTGIMRLVLNLIEMGELFIALIYIVSLTLQYESNEINNKVVSSNTCTASYYLCGCNNTNNGINTLSTNTWISEKD